MAKKGAAQQLQADLQNDEDFEKFVERPGLLVLDVYAEWCGPCLGMVGALRKIKLEVGGDNLHLAICKAEGITALKRFSRKSEPTWLFLKNGKAVNIYFGTNVPQLMSIITRELQTLGQPLHTFYEISELQPIEVQRRKVIEDAKAENLRIEETAKEKKRVSYLIYVTDTIMENIPDMGVTLFGPQVNRDMFKKLQEPADALKIQCKDRKTVVITPENFDIINFQCVNPLSSEVIEQLIGKELLICFWKVPDEGNNIPIILNKYAHELTKPHFKLSDETGEEQELPPLLAPLNFKIEKELEEGEEWLEEIEELPPPAPIKMIENIVEGTIGEGGDEDEEDVEDEDENEEGVTEVDKPPILEMNDFDFGLQLETVEAEEEEEEEKPEEVQKKRTKKIIVKIPPIWVPNDHRTHAALIYVFFRAATLAFLPPDPKPEPPHVIMAFDTYKKRDLIAHAERNKNDVPLYGFFTSDNPDEAKFIANSDVKYAQQPHSSGDKLVFKVNKATSNTMLSLVTYGPSYVSPNTVVGAEEAKKFFPESYKTAEQELAEKSEMEKDENKGKKKKKVRTSEPSTSQAAETVKATSTPTAEVQTSRESDATAFPESEPAAAYETTKGADTEEAQEVGPPDTTTAEGEIPSATQPEGDDSISPTSAETMSPEAPQETTAEQLQEAPSEQPQDAPAAPTELPQGAPTTPAEQPQEAAPTLTEQTPATPTEQPPEAPTEQPPEDPTEQPQSQISPEQPTEGPAT